MEDRVNKNNFIGSLVHDQVREAFHQHADGSYPGKLARPLEIESEMQKRRPVQKDNAVQRQGSDSNTTHVPAGCPSRHRV